MQDLNLGSAGGILFLEQEIESGPPALGAQSLSYWTTKGVPEWKS